MVFQFPQHQIPRIDGGFSDWGNVTESYLENFEKELVEAVAGTEYIHAQVGFTEGQVPDSRNPF